MRHRHNGPKVKYITRRNNIRYRQRPTHSQMDKYKNLNYKQLRKKFRISPLADDDKDKVLNYKDCRPWDKRKQDSSDLKNALKDIRALRDELNDIVIQIEDVRNEPLTPESKEKEQQLAIKSRRIESSINEIQQLLNEGIYET